MPAGTATSPTPEPALGPSSNRSIIASDCTPRSIIGHLPSTRKISLGLAGRGPPPHPGPPPPPPRVCLAPPARRKKNSAGGGGGRPPPTKPSPQPADPYFAVSHQGCSSSLSRK